MRARVFTLCAALALACNTFDTRTDPGYDGPRTFSGARQSLDLAKSAFFQLNVPFFLFWVGDALLSGVADTLLLPITIPEQSKLNAEQTQSLRTDVEQPGVLRKIENEEPLKTAKRLFRACKSLVLSFDPKFTDCYSINAKIELDDAGDNEVITGAVYKKRLREGFAPLGGKGRFISLKDETFEEHAPTITISVRREDSKDDTKTPLTWVVGPGTDGEWRILEERSIGFP